MKVLETEYGGIMYRSRTEARWAVYFDIQNIKHVYEPECYVLGNGYRYTPDFLLPDPNLFVEVKPNNDAWEDDYHRNRWEMLCTESKTDIMIAAGIPSVDCFNCFIYENITGVSKAKHIEVVFSPNTKYQHLFVWPGVNVGESFEDGMPDDLIMKCKEACNYRFYK